MIVDLVVDELSFLWYYVIVISMLIVMVVLVIVIIVVICLLRKEDSKRKCYDSVCFIVVIVSKDVEDLDCYYNFFFVYKEVFYLFGYDLGNR